MNQLAVGNLCMQKADLRYSRISTPGAVCVPNLQIVQGLSVVFFSPNGHCFSEVLKHFEILASCLALVTNDFLMNLTKLQANKAMSHNSFLSPGIFSNGLLLFSLQFSVHMSLLGEAFPEYVFFGCLLWPVRAPS